MKTTVMALLGLLALILLALFGLYVYMTINLFYEPEKEPTRIDYYEMCPLEPPAPRKRFMGLPRLQIGGGVFSPSDNLLAISMYQNDERKGVFLTDYKGRVLRWLCRGGRPAAFTPDGNYVVVITRPRGEYTQVWLFSVDGEYARKIGYVMMGDSSFAPSPDGKRIFFTRARFKGQRLNNYDRSVVYFDVSSREEYEALGRGIIDGNFLAIFPDGNHFLVEVSTGSFKDAPLWKVPLNNYKNPIPIVPDLSRYNPEYGQGLGGYGFEPIRHPKLSGNGKWLAFSYENPPGKKIYGQPLYVCNMDNMDTERLTPEDWYAVPRDISQDGSKILFDHGKADDSEIDSMVIKNSTLWMINRDGSGLHQIPLDFSDMFPDKARPLVDFSTLEPRPDEVRIK